MKKEGNSLLESLVALAFVAPPLMVLNGLLFSVLWRWFAVEPLGAPPLRVVDAMGVSLLVSWFLLALPRKEPNPDHGPLRALLVGAIPFLVFFGLAAIVHAFQ